jgi:hypothetical protein
MPQQRVHRQGQDENGLSETTKRGLENSEIPYGENPMEKQEADDNNRAPEIRNSGTTEEFGNGHSRWQ